MRIFIILTILTLVLFGCAIQTRPTQASPTKTSIPTPIIRYTASPLPTSTNGETGIVLTITPSPVPRSVFYFGATPQMSQAGGISGVFYCVEPPDETCAQNYSVLRFYEDGLVMEVPICDNDATEDFLGNVWPSMSTWFYRENDITDPRGVYFIVENKIWFTTVAEYVSHTVVTDYFGTFSKERLILNSFSHYNGHEKTEREFFYLDIITNP